MEQKPCDVTSKSKLLAYFEKYMLAVALLGQMIFFAQGIKIFLTHSANDVSLTGFSFSLIACMSWVVYGVLIKNRVLIIANIFAIIGAIFVIIGSLLYT